MTKTPDESLDEMLVYAKRQVLYAEQHRDYALGQIARQTIESNRKYYEDEVARSVDRIAYFQPHVDVLIDIINQRKAGKA